MPATVAKRGEKFRVVEADSRRIVKNKAGTAVDGGGHRSRAAAQRQAIAINSSKRSK